MMTMMLVVEQSYLNQTETYMHTSMCTYETIDADDDDDDQDDQDNEDNHADYDIHDGEEDCTDDFRHIA